MTMVVLISVAVVIGSLVLVLAALRYPAEMMRGYVYTGITLFLLGVSGLVPYLISAGPVRNVTTAVFIAAIVWFMALDVRFLRRRLRSQ